MDGIEGREKKDRIDNGELVEILQRRGGNRQNAQQKESGKRYDLGGGVEEEVHENLERVGAAEMLQHGRERQLRHGRRSDRLLETPVEDVQNHHGAVGRSVHVRLHEDLEQHRHPRHIAADLLDVLGIGQQALQELEQHVEKSVCVVLLLFDELHHVAQIEEHAAIALVLVVDHAEALQEDPLLLHGLRR